MVKPLERSTLGPEAAAELAAFPGRPERTFCKSDSRILGAASLGFVVVVVKGVLLLAVVVVVVVADAPGVDPDVVVVVDPPAAAAALDLCLDPPELGELVMAAKPLPLPKSCINWD